ncbi:hypothetical protein T484DRAFT_1792197 [Baffinella frigidus]|nr:hypothetical protein T484DRAFT_1792197 [Cryptophyta sp. CCMP2293]
MTLDSNRQRLRTFDSWPHSDTTHTGVTPKLLAADGFYFNPTAQLLAADGFYFNPTAQLLAADGFYFNPTAQDPDTVICFFCDLQLGDWTG